MITQIVQLNNKTYHDRTEQYDRGDAMFILAPLNATVSFMSKLLYYLFNTRKHYKANKDKITKKTINKCYLQIKTHKFTPYSPTITIISKIFVHHN